MNRTLTTIWLLMLGWIMLSGCSTDQSTTQPPIGQEGSTGNSHPTVIRQAATGNPNNGKPIVVPAATPLSGGVPLLVHLWDNGSSDPDGDQLVSWEWNFADEEEGQGGWYDYTATQGDAWHTYSSAGTYTAHLRITDSTGRKGVDHIQITLDDGFNANPIAIADANPLSGDAPLEVSFSAPGSYDPDGNIVKYEWDFGTGIFLDYTPSQGEVSTAYGSGGFYTAILRVTDDDGAIATDSVIVEVNSPPTAVASANPTSGATPLTTHLSAQGSYDPDGLIVSYEWDFGEGEGFQDFTSTQGEADHIYTQVNSYTATLRVTDDSGKAITASIKIEVLEPNGNLKWAKRAGGSSGYDGGWGITTLSDDSTVVTGAFYGSATFGSSESNQTILTSTGSTDIFIARYNPDGTLAWAKRAGGTATDLGIALIGLSDGSTVVTGYFETSATFGSSESNQTVLTSTGSDDIFVAHYNPDGTFAWAKRAGGAYSDWGYGTTMLSDNSIVVTGWFSGSATFGPGEPNQTVLAAVSFSDTFIAHYNPDGTLAWAKRAGGDYGCGITTLSDNSTVITGYFGGSAVFGSGESNQTILTAAGSIDIFVAHYNPDGTLAWAKRAGGDSSSIYDQGYGITTLSDDSTIVTGLFYGSATFGSGESNQTILTAAGGGDIFVARYNQDGTLAWAKRAGGVSGDEGYGITMLSDNSTVVTGWFSGSSTFGPGEPNQIILTSTGYDDVFIARYNPDGTLAWAKRAGGAPSERGYGITTLSDDSTVATGLFYGSATFGPGEPNQTILTAAGGGDIFVARFAP